LNSLGISSFFNCDIQALAGVSRFNEEIPASGAVRERQPNTVILLLVLPGNIIRTIEILQWETPTMAVCIVGTFRHDQGSYPALAGVSLFNEEIPASGAVREHQPNTVILLLVLPGNIIRTIEVLQWETPTMALS
jgi:hypothetical protein